MKITVTKKHIEQGKPCHQRLCPVALAIRAKLNTNDVAAWPSSGIFIKGEMFAVPDEVRHFMAAFDDPNGKCDVRPFSFELVKA